MTNKTLGQLVADYRKRQEWSQEELAEKSGLTTRTVSAIEQGQVKDPRLSTVCALSYALGFAFFTETYRYNYRLSKSQSEAPQPEAI